MTRGVAWLVALVGVAITAYGCAGPAPSGSAGNAVSSSPVVSGIATPASTPTPPPRLVACPRDGHALGARTRVTAHPAAGLSVCDYRLVARSGERPACTSATLMINTAAQAYTDFNRWVDEAVQNSDVGQPGLAPRQIHAPELGLQAEWVPGRQTLESGRPGEWITVVMACRLPAAYALRIARRVADGVSHS